MREFLDFYLYTAWEISHGVWLIYLPTSEEQFLTNLQNL